MELHITPALALLCEHHLLEPTDQFKDFAENDWPDIKDYLTEKGQQDGDFLKQKGGKAYQNSVKAFKKAVRNLDQKVNGTSIHKDDK